MAGCTVDTAWKGSETAPPGGELLMTVPDLSLLLTLWNRQPHTGVGGDMAALTLGAAPASALSTSRSRCRNRIACGGVARAKGLTPGETGSAWVACARSGCCTACGRANRPGRRLKGLSCALRGWFQKIMGDTGPGVFAMVLRVERPAMPNGSFR